MKATRPYRGNDQTQLYKKMKLSCNNDGHRVRMMRMLERARLGLPLFEPNPRPSATQDRQAS
jgi:hypothetical protein